GRQRGAAARLRSGRALPAAEVAADRARVPPPLPHRHGDDARRGQAGGGRRHRRRPPRGSHRLRQCQPGDRLRPAGAAGGPGTGGPAAGPVRAAARPLSLLAPPGRRRDNGPLAVRCRIDDRPAALSPPLPHPGPRGPARVPRRAAAGGTMAYFACGSLSRTDPLPYPRLSRIQVPADLRAFPAGELPAIADELRAYLIEQVAQSGGHFGAGLGVIELTVALHWLYDTPVDRLVWDVGHQTYPHKILTGRRDRIHTVKQKDGVAPFPKREESEYDTFGVGHSSTS